MDFYDPKVPFTPAKASTTQCVLFFSGFAKEMAKRLDCSLEQLSDKVQELVGLFHEFDQIKKTGSNGASHIALPDVWPKVATPRKTKRKREQEDVAVRAMTTRKDIKDGLRPRLAEAIYQVMGSDVCTSDDIIDRLRQKNWLPRSNGPKRLRSYILMVLSVNKDLFENIEPGSGRYRAIEQKVATPSLFGEDEPLARQILIHLRVRPGITARASDVAKSVGSTPEKVRAVLIQAKDVNLVAVSKRKKSVLWEILPQGATYVAM